MHQILATAVGAVMSGIGFLIGRWLRRDERSERIDRRLRLVSLYTKMQGAGLDHAALNQFEAGLEPGKSAQNPGKPAKAASVRIIRCE